MTSTARLKSRNGDLTWLSRIGLTGATLAVADRVGQNPQLVFLMAGAAALGIFAALPIGLFLGVVILLRDLSDAFADSPLAMGLNGGALIGVLAILAGGLRVIGRTNLRGLGGLLFVMLLVVIWTGVGFLNFGINGSIIRELVRMTSILVVALVAVVSIRRFADVDRIVGIVVFVTVVEAVIALVDWLLNGHLHDRVRGTFDHPNTAAAAFAVALALSFWKLLERRSGIYLFAAVVLAIATLGTRSLGGLAQMIVTLIVYSFMARAGRRRAVVALVFGLIVIGVFSLTPLGQDRVKQVAQTQSYANAAQGQQSNSLDWRFGNWSRLFAAWRVHPFFGYGGGSTTKLVQPGGSIPHSDYMRYLVETGVFGFLAYGVIFAALFNALYRRARAPDDSSSFATAMFAIVVGLMVHGLVNNITLETTVMYMLAVLIGGVFGVTAHAQQRPSGSAVSVAPAA